MLSFRRNWLSKGDPKQKNKWYLFWRGNFCGNIKEQIVSIWSFDCEQYFILQTLQIFTARLNSAEKQFQAEVTIQAFCNLVAFLASFQKLRSLILKCKVSFVRWHALFEFIRLQSLKQKIKLLSEMHRRPFTHSLKAMISSRKSVIIVAAFYLAKSLQIGNMTAINPLTFMGRIIRKSQCVSNFNEEVFHWIQ